MRMDVKLQSKLDIYSSNRIVLHAGAPGSAHLAFCLLWFYGFCVWVVRFDLMIPTISIWFSLQLVIMLCYNMTVLGYGRVSKKC